MRRGLISALVAVLVVAGLIAVTTSGSGKPGREYKIELQNAFGLVKGADFKVAGVKAGSIKSISLDQKTLNAVVTVSITQPGLGDFHQDAECLSRPQSLIGEYFISCDPGSSGPVMPSGSFIKVTHTQSTIPADLLQNVLRLPYRERLSLIIGELGAAVAGRSQDLHAALQRAVPALTETDNLLNLLGNDSATLKQLTSSSDAVVTELANNTTDVDTFIDQANRAATDTATQDANLQTTFQRLPGFLEQLRPALAKLSTATRANEPALANLHAASGQLDQLFVNLPAFARASRPAISALGSASRTGETAVKAADPTVSLLNRFATNTPDLAQNLAIVTHVIDDRKYAVEKNPESPGGKGYTGLEALLQFAFNLAAATNTYGPYGHQLAVDAFVSAMCTPYASAGTVASNLAMYGAAARSCYAWLGPNQPGVNETDPSAPAGTCVPDPGGTIPGGKPPTTGTGACKLAAAVASQPAARPARRSTAPSTSSPTPTRSTPSPVPASVPSVPGASGVTGAAGGAVGGVIKGVTGAAKSGVSGATGAAGAATGAAGSAAGNLLGYLIGP